MVFAYAPVPDDLVSTAGEWREKWSAAAEAGDELDEPSTRKPAT